MSSFSRFQDINQKRGIANQKTNSSFILKGYPSISICGEDETQIDACVVNRQEQDMAYIYTHLDDKLKLGSSWSAKGLHWLISEEIITIKDVSWNKYVAFLCNMEINGHWGYFIGPEKTYINVALKQDHVLQSQAKPMLVLASGLINIGDKIKIKNRVWLVQEEDSISTDGVSYYSLRADTMSKHIDTIEKDSNITPEIEPSDPTKLTFRPNENISVATELGYFKSNNSSLQVKELNEDKVIFSIPFGIAEVSIEVKQKGIIQTLVLKQEM